MQIKKIVFFSIAICSTSICFALSLSEAPIQRVTLYPTTAKIERVIPVQAGEQIINLTGLAANFDMSQLQYQTVNIDVNAVSHSDSAMDKPSGHESQKIKQQIEALENKISQQNSIIQAAELQNKFLGNITKGSARAVRNKAYDAFIAIDKAKIEKQKLEQRVEELNHDLESIGDHTFNQRSIKFYVQAPKKGEIKLSYMVQHARWQPIYKAELNTSGNTVKLTRMAMIAQKTGEDWNNIHLILSTSTPKTYVNQLHPESWWVDYYEPQSVLTTPSAQPLAKMVMRQPTPRNSSHSNEESTTPQFPAFQMNNLNLSAEFRSETKASIGSSQQQIYLPLSAEQYPAKISIWTIPKQTNHASIYAEIQKLDSNWPSGIVKLYRDGDYVGQRNWDNNNTDQTIHMDFGIDEQIQIKVIELLDKKNAVVNDQSETIQKQRYIVQNLHPHLVDVMLFDTAPQSRNGKLKTKSTYSLIPDSSIWNQQPNINQWKFQLTPKQSFELEVEHEFVYPKTGRTSGF